MNYPTDLQPVPASTEACPPWQREAPLGAGGTGAVFRVRRGEEVRALKWYHPNPRAQDIQAALAHLAQFPMPSSSFLWPLEVVHEASLTDFGCLMPLREGRFRSLSDLMQNRPTSASYPAMRQLLRAAAELTQAFEAIHLLNLAWCDFSTGNVFIDPATGELQLCDIDGLCPAENLKPHFHPDPRFAAPELIEGHAPPSSDSDLFTLALALFCLLVGRHPMENPQLIFPTDAPRFHPPGDSAAPSELFGESRQAAARWKALTSSLREAFQLEFSNGVPDPQSRPSTKFWLSELRKASDQLIDCPTDGFASCVDTLIASGVEATTELAPRLCPICNREILPGARLVIDRQLNKENPPSPTIVLLTPETKLYQYHFSRDGEPREIVAQAQAHPNRPRTLGLRNVGNRSWKVVLSEGTEKQVDPGFVLELTDGAVVTIGDSNCHVYSNQ